MKTRIVPYRPIIQRLHNHSAEVPDLETAACHPQRRGIVRSLNSFSIQALSTKACNEPSFGNETRRDLQSKLGLDMRSISIIAILLFTTCSARATPTSIVPGRSLGRIHLGSTRSEVHGALGPPSDPGYGSYEYYYGGKDKKTTLIICYQFGAVVEIITDSPKFSTSSNISIRSSFVQVRRSDRNFRKSAHEEQDVCAYVLDDVARGLAYQFTAPVLYAHGKITAGFLPSSAKPVYIAIHVPGKPWSGYTSSY